MNPTHPNQYSNKPITVADIIKNTAAAAQEGAAGSEIWPAALAGWQQDLLLQLELS